MNGRYILLTIGIILFLSVCSEKEYRIGIMFTNSQNKAIKYAGFYRVSLMEDSVPMSGHTPGQYAFFMKESDTLTGCFWKDTLDYLDTLQFDLYVDGEPIIDQGLMPWPNVIVDFHYP